MHEVITHKTTDLNKAITIQAGEPGAGGAPTIYTLFIPDSVPTEQGGVHTVLNFQSKPIASPADYNGLTNEALAAVLLDRMMGFQSGPFKCSENELIIAGLKNALFWMQNRTNDRVKRGVEGKLEK